jgi:hypothetical protein
MSSSIMVALISSMFCADGSPIVKNACPDGKPPVQIEISVLKCFPDEPPNYINPCADHLVSLLELKRNGEIILTVPADKLTPSELKGLFWAAFGGADKR